MILKNLLTAKLLLLFVSLPALLSSCSLVNNQAEKIDRSSLYRKDLSFDYHYRASEISEKIREILEENDFGVITENRQDGSFLIKTAQKELTLRHLVSSKNTSDGRMPKNLLGRVLIKVRAKSQNNCEVKLKTIFKKTKGLTPVSNGTLEIFILEKLNSELSDNVA